MRRSAEPPTPPPCASGAVLHCSPREGSGMPFGQSAHGSHCPAAVHTDRWFRIWHLVPQEHRDSTHLAVFHGVDSRKGIDVIADEKMTEIARNTLGI